MLKRLFNKPKLKEVEFVNRNIVLADIGKRMYYDNEFNTNQQILFAYLNVPQLRAVIDYRAKVFGDNYPKIIDSKGDEIENHALLELFENPNPLYSEGEFWETYSKQLDLFGVVYIYVQKPIGMKPTGLLILPAQNLTVKVKDQYNILDETDLITEYQLDVNGTTYHIPPENIWSFTDTSLNLDQNGFITPDSKVTTLKDPLNNILAAYKVRNTVVAKGGPVGIFSNENVGDAGVIKMREEKDKLERRLGLDYGLAGQDKQAIITDARLKYQKIGVDISQLEIYEGFNNDTATIANAYEFPLPLLNNPEGTTFNNFQTADKVLYTKSIIPIWNKTAKSINKYFQLGTEKWMFETEQIEVLQEDKKLSAEVSKLQTEMIINLNTSVASGLMTKENAIETLVNIAEISRDTAELLIRDDAQPEENENQEQTTEI